MSRALHPVLTPEERQQLIDEGRRMFNAGRFYDCHEAWETVWRSTTPEPKDLFRGLIQIAVAFYHHTERQRDDVALRVLTKGRRRVEPFAPTACGLDIGSLLAQLEPWARYFARSRDVAPPFPTLRLQRQASPWDERLPTEPPG